MQYNNTTQINDILAMALPWWQHHKHCRGYYFYYYYYPSDVDTNIITQNWQCTKHVKVNCGDAPQHNWLLETALKNLHLQLKLIRML